MDEQERQPGLAKNPVLRLFVLGLSVSVVVYITGIGFSDFTPADALWVFTSCTFATTVLGVVSKRIESNQAKLFVSND